MIGIVGYGTYIPQHRLARSRIAEATGEPALPGTRAVAGPDEDSVTMAVAAAAGALVGGGPVDAVYLATTTPPYQEKQAAATLVTALGLGPAVRTASFGGSLQAGAAALLAACDAVRAGSARQVLVAAADMRPAAPQGALEQVVGDGAAAFVLGSGPGVLAEIEGAYSVSADVLTQWRGHGDAFPRSWEERFVVSEAYGPLITQALRGLLEQTGIGLQAVAKVVLQPLHPRHHAALASGLKLTKEQVQDALFAQVGLAGAAAAPLMLAAALAEAQPGQRIVYVSYGDGADAILLRATDQVAAFRPGRTLAEWLAAGTAEYLTYSRYLRWRGLVPAEPGRRPGRERPSAPALWRNQEKNLGGMGSRCTACGTPQFPPQRVCVQCQAIDQMEPYGFVGRPARLTTYTADYLAAAIEPPTLVGVVDFAGGGRMLTELTDCQPADLAPGLPVELTFRRLFETEGISNYGWKARLVSGAASRGEGV